MPTVATFGPYRVFFYSADRAEPVHVHVEREHKVAKFWLDPVRLARSGGFSRKELGRIEAFDTPLFREAQPVASRQRALPARRVKGCGNMRPR